MKINVAVLVEDSNGAPDVLAFEVHCSEGQYNEGEHYEIAKNRVRSDGYNAISAFDERDPAWDKFTYPDVLENIQNTDSKQSQEGNHIFIVSRDIEYVVTQKYAVLAEDEESAEELLEQILEGGQNLPDSVIFLSDEMEQLENSLAHNTESCSLDALNDLIKGNPLTEFSIRNHSMELYSETLKYQVDPDVSKVTDKILFEVTEPKRAFIRMKALMGSGDRVFDRQRG